MIKLREPRTDYLEKGTFYIAIDFLKLISKM